MEAELRDLLRNSKLTQAKKLAFETLLQSTFDLFQAPYTRGDTKSLIDSSTLSLYTKMQELVGSLASLLIEEEAANIEDDEFDDEPAVNARPMRVQSPSFRSQTLPVFEERRYSTLSSPRQRYTTPHQKKTRTQSVYSSPPGVNSPLASRDGPSSKKRYSMRF